MISRFFIELNENLYLLFPFFENTDKMGQEIRAFQTEQRFDRAFTVRFDHAKAAVQSQNVDNVVLPSSLSEPMGLPKVSSSPTTSSMSSRIWKAMPKLSA